MASSWHATATSAIGKAVCGTWCACDFKFVCLFVCLFWRTTHIDTCLFDYSIFTSQCVILYVQVFAGTTGGISFFLLLPTRFSACHLLFFWRFISFSFIYFFIVYFKIADKLENEILWHLSAIFWQAFPLRIAATPMDFPSPASRPPLSSQRSRILPLIL